MPPSPSEPRRRWWHAPVRITGATVLACAACCALPWLAAASGSVVLTGLAAWAEPLAGAVLMVGLLAGLLGAGAWWLRRRAATPAACDLDGPCRPRR